MSHLTLLARLSQCVLWLSAIPNRLRLNGVTRKDYVVRVTLHHRCCMAVRLHQLVLRTKKICLRDVFHTNSLASTQIPCCRGSLAGCSAITIRVRLYRATRKDYVFRVKLNTMCFLVVVCSSHVSNMIMI